MEQLITHACGHVQAHHLVGYASQQERKARWLPTTDCRSCYIAGKRAEQTEAALRNDAAIAHVELPALAGSDRQIAWATTIRAGCLASMLASPEIGTGWQSCLTIIDAKWWIDHRTLTGADLISKAASTTTVSTITVDAASLQSQTA
ncbi:MAG: hypothetical protein EOO77_16560 [Oxalobacteraceae bacterium]|nr:MAG: hypothetical protein EOO77_16560 [Oxalobacteraceae bacterium]